MTEPREEEEVDEEAELAAFAEAAIRAPKGGAYERMLAQHLITATVSDPVNAIIHVCRAALSLPREAMEELGIDREEVETVLTVALNFRLSKPTGSPERHPILWSFAKLGEEGFRRYVEPWLTAPLGILLPEDEDEEALRSLPRWRRFYEACRRLSPTGYSALAAAFASWAYPFIQELSRKLASQIPSSTYMEVLALARGLRKEAEEA